MSFAGNDPLNLAGEIYFCTPLGDKLPESTGDDSPNSIGETFCLDCTGEMAPLGVSCIPPGNILILRLKNIKSVGDALILAGEYLYTL